MLQLSFNICQSDCSTIEFTETTGLYEITSNPTGWGTQFSTINPDVDTFLYAQLEFFDTNGTSIKLIEIQPDFPTINTLYSKKFTVDLPDNLYKIVYTVKENKTSSVSYSATNYQGFYCNVSCCVSNMLKDIDIDCKCIDHKLEEYNKAYALLQGLICAAECGNISQFNNILSVINKLCKNKKCKC